MNEPNPNNSPRDIFPPIILRVSYNPVVRSYPATNSGGLFNSTFIFEGSRKRKSTKNSSLRLQDLLNRPIDEITSPDLECSICMSNIQHRIFLVPCKHAFCHSCISRWFAVRRTCPLCISLPNMIVMKIESEETYAVSRMANYCSITIVPEATYFFYPRKPETYISYLLHNAIARNPICMLYIFFLLPSLSCHVPNAAQVMKMSNILNSNHVKHNEAVQFILRVFDFLNVPKKLLNDRKFRQTLLTQFIDRYNQNSKTHPTKTRFLSVYQYVTNDADCLEPFMPFDMRQQFWKLLIAFHLHPETDFYRFISQLSFNGYTEQDPCRYESILKNKFVELLQKDPMLILPMIALVAQHFYSGNSMDSFLKEVIIMLMDRHSSSAKIPRFEMDTKPEVIDLTSSPVLNTQIPTGVSGDCIDLCSDTSSESINLCDASTSTALPERRWQSINLCAMDSSVIVLSSDEESDSS